LLDPEGILAHGGAGGHTGLRGCVVAAADVVGLAEGGIVKYLLAVVVAGGERGRLLWLLLLLLRRAVSTEGSETVLWVRVDVVHTSGGGADRVGWTPSVTVSFLRGVGGD
jgi:hypothetical protein